MEPIWKVKPIRLKGKRLQKLLQMVFERDKHCQECKSPYNLEIHHIEFKSHGGSDTAENLITLCVCCHGLKHGNKKVK